MTAKRLFDLALTVPGLIVLAPVLVALALWIKCDSRGPVLFRQLRVGQYCQHFHIYKFRTMVVDAERLGARVTSGGDPRVTRAGRCLRKSKLDELPQLVNVLKGEMSLVGPRPEVPEYVAHYPEASRHKVLSVAPGITDPGSLAFRNENEILVGVSDPAEYYVEEILPEKLRYYEEYVDNCSLALDLRVIFRTLSHWVS